MSAEAPPKPPGAWAAQAAQRGRAAWPGFAVSEEELERTATLRLEQGGEAGDEGPASLDAAELYVATACARGDRGALLGFRARYFEPVTPSLRRMGLPDAQHDDVWQKLCERLFVGNGDAPPRITRYAGGGDLPGLVKVAATRLALDWLEQDRRLTGVGDSWLQALPAGASDPEMHAMKSQHRAELKEELETAIASLDPRERMILRLHLVERLGIDAIASLCAVHRATAARMVVRAKESLADRVRLRLAERWSIGDTSMLALKTLVDSQLELSLERLLAAS